MSSICARSSWQSALWSTVAFALARTRTLIAWDPNCSELRVSLESAAVGATHTTSTVVDLPPKAVDRSRVSLESRKGGLPILPRAASAVTQRPRQVREVLMATASSKATPVTSDRFTRSEPAKSTRKSRPCVTLWDLRPLTDRTMTVWLRLDVSLSIVEVVTRKRSPVCRASKASAAEDTESQRLPARLGPSLGVSRISTGGPSGSSRSCTVSM
mmetsp:Transcript_1202/g.3419  ORF Transcript_1202/g.3419 Transcript_1202/m.3419 type:complete len:214 (+) Transcript_1202:3506-4147(+)